MEISYSINGYSYGHILTIWGAEYDIRVNVVAIYISDSDDKNEKKLGMKRLNVYNNGNMNIRLTSDTNHNSGDKAEEFYSL